MAGGGAAWGGPSQMEEFPTTPSNSKVLVASDGEGNESDETIGYSEDEEIMQPEDQLAAHEDRMERQEMEEEQDEIGDGDEEFQFATMVEDEDEEYEYHQ